MCACDGRRGESLELVSSAGRGDGKKELGSSLQLPNFSLLNPAPGVSPQPPPPTTRPRSRTAETLPRPRSPGGLARQGPAAAGGGRAAPRRPSGAWLGRGLRRGQSAGEAVAGPRLAGPGGSNLRGLAWSFEPLHPLAARKLLQPPCW